MIAKQLFLFIIAAAFAFYQVSKIQKNVSSTKLDGIKQLEDITQSIDRIIQMILKKETKLNMFRFYYFMGHQWQNTFGFNKKMDSLKDEERSILLIGTLVLTEENKDDESLAREPKLFAEAFIDPVELNRVLSKMDRKKKSKGWAMNRKGKRGNVKKNNPLVSLRVYDPLMFPIAEALLEKKKIARVIPLGNAKPKNNANGDNDKNKIITSDKTGLKNKKQNPDKIEEPLCSNDHNSEKLNENQCILN